MSRVAVRLGRQPDAVLPGSPPLSPPLVRELRDTWVADVVIRQPRRVARDDLGQVRLMRCCVGIRGLRNLERLTVPPVRRPEPAEERFRPTHPGTILSPGALAGPAASRAAERDRKSLPVGASVVVSPSAWRLGPQPTDGETATRAPAPSTVRSPGRRPRGESAAF